MTQSIDIFKDRVKNIDIEKWIISRSNYNIPITQLNHIINGIKSMIEHLAGISCAGSFIRAVLKNDLKETMTLADDINAREIQLYVKFINEFVPEELIMGINSKIHTKGGNILSQHLTDDQLHELVNSNVKLEDIHNPDIKHIQTCEECKSRYIGFVDLYNDIMKDKCDEDHMRED